ncbi:MAG: alpha-amylase [Lachnospiraceae bacterium]|nr:alpha-amylase [Lachnospiraceae bacterium]
MDNADPIEVLFPESVCIGRLYSVRIKGIPAKYDRYRILDGKREIADPCSFRLFGLSDIQAHPDPSEVFGHVLAKPPVDYLDRAFASRLRTRIAPEDDFIYLLHVRGFTMSPSAGVPKAHHGTFAGIIDKLDHITSLGATAVELMPAYELIAREPVEQPAMVMPAVLSGKDGEQEPEERINYWGYKEGYYFAPRSAYAASDNACAEFLSLVTALHKRRLAIILQFWFPQDYPTPLICMVLRHWVRFYGVDGFHLIGGGLAIESIASDPALSGVKLYYESIDPSKLLHSGEKRMLSLYRGDFAMTVRRFVKGDDHAIGAFFGQMIQNQPVYGNVNYVAGYDGFRLLDIVSYEHKHNEANRENNADGATDNAGWNCGVEGKTRRQSVMKLRRKQIFNMLTMLFFAQGTPMLYAGDEFLHTQEGNNNPYCQDNAISWINWRGETTAQGEAALNFIRFLSAYRKKHAILRQAKPLRLMDYKAFGFPDLSAHGVEAWQPDFSEYSHSVGMLYCCLYAREQDPAFLFCIYNAHWESRRFALPAIPKPLSWTVVIDTGNTGAETEERSLKGEKTVVITARSCLILEARGRFRMNDKEARTPF